MKIAITVIAAFLVAASIMQAAAATASRPVVLVFDTVPGEGVDKTLAASSTKALCSYLRDTQRVDAIRFDRESPTVLRAIMDKQLTADQVASYSSQQERIQVAKALAYEYAAGAEGSIKNGIVDVKVWLAKVEGGKKDRWEASGQASTGTTGERGYDNAMQSATSAAVINIARQAFAALPSVAEKEPSTGSQTTAIGPEPVANPNRPTAGDYVGQADESLQAGNVAIAIQQYQQAVNADPSNPALRLKLADAYARKGMYDEAASEIDGAVKMGAAADQVTAARDKIDKMKAGQQVTRVDTPNSGAASPNVVQPPKPEPKPEPKSALAKMREGDKLWRANQPDEAANAYKEAIKFDPSEWRAYERLTLVDASMSLFGESRTVLEQLARVQPNPSPQMVTSRYQLFSKVFEQCFDALFKQYDRDSADYDKKIISRESYYSSIKGLGLRLESMAKFVDVLPCPDGKKAANLHRSLACGLVAQAATSLQDYLETNNADSKSNAETFISQAKRELETVTKLESGQTAGAGQ